MSLFVSILRPYFHAKHHVLVSQSARKSKFVFGSCNEVDMLSAELRAWRQDTTLANSDSIV